MMVINKDKPVVSVSALIHNNGSAVQRWPTGAGSTVQRQGWPGQLWSDHSSVPHPGGVVSGVGMSGGGGGVGRLSPPLPPMEGISSPSATPTGGNFTLGNNSNGPPSPGLSSPSFTLGSPSNSNYPATTSSYPPNHPLSGSKHLCAICEDRASGKHYGVFSCEGCKGFFKRTVRKELQYACRENKNCTIDKRHRNRCQFCRYNKCLHMGMKREAVQEERQRTKASGGGSVASGEKDGVAGDAITSAGGIHLDMPVAAIRDAELMVDTEDEDTKPLMDEKEVLSLLGFGARKTLTDLVKWAKRIPHFSNLDIQDQILLLKNGWNELLVAAISYRSMRTTDGLLLTDGINLNRANATNVGMTNIYDRVRSELIAKMKDMAMDRTELGCLKTIVLYNPDVKGLTSPAHIECLRERVYSALEDYTKANTPTEAGRFPKLLLRLPALRSIGLRCMEHIFFHQIFTTPAGQPPPVDMFLTTKLNEELSSSP